MCEVHEIHGVFVYIASVNIINIFYSEFLICVDNIFIL